MPSIYSNVLSSDDINYLNNLPEVLAAKAKLDASSSGMTYFSVELTHTIRQALSTHMSLSLEGVETIPMRWIKGDTAPHIDTGASEFENTYLVYLNDSPGAFVLEGDSYPIAQNTGFIFQEGLSHKTEATGQEARLLLGPMNEFAEPVGSSLTYYATEADALSYSSPIAYGYDWTVGNISSGSIGAITHWRLASNSSGTSSQAIVYNNGDVLNSDGSYHLYPTIPCFREGTKILCEVDGKEEYVRVEEMRNGTLVKTSRDGFKKVVVIAKGTVENPGTSERTENRLYKCSPSNYPALTEDLFITGCHSILEYPITEKQKEDTIKHLGKLFVTDNKYRLMACVDERAEPWASEGTYTIYHFALEHEDDGMNYGVYANGGLLVETCAIRTLKNRTNMTVL